MGIIMNIRNKRIAFLGDSITQGTGASKRENCFVEVFSKITNSKLTYLRKYTDLDYQLYLL